MAANRRRSTRLRDEPASRGLGVVQGLLRGEGLRGTHEERGVGLDPGQGLGDVRGIDVGDEVHA